MTGPPLRATELGALSTLATAGRNGAPQPLLTAQGFNTRLIRRLVSKGLVASVPEKGHAGRKTTEIAKVRITNAGRRVIEG